MVKRIPLIVFGMVVALAAIAALSFRPASVATTHVRVGWGGSEGHPSCVYDARQHAVHAKVLVVGTSRRNDVVTVTVTAYADENTSQPVGSADRNVRVSGTVHAFVFVTIPVTKAPHIGEDDVAACRLAARSLHQAELPLF